MVPAGPRYALYKQENKDGLECDWRFGGSDWRCGARRNLAYLSIQVRQNSAAFRSATRAHIEPTGNHL